jgi:probable rRNA maturation factor
MITIEPLNIVAISVKAAASPLSKLGLARFVMRARSLAGIAGQVDVLLTDDATMQRLNRSFRGKNKATDVLSFPALDLLPQDGPERHTGDLAISLEIAARQAGALGHSLGDEVRILILHGLLHLAGFDHERDGGEMAAREAELRAELELPVNLIARVAIKRVAARRKRGVRA